MATVLIKKYGNRRLYDTGDSRYVTLDELATKIRSGIDLRVVDAQTNDDLTQATLTQIVLETGHAAKFLPVQLLTQMIRLSDDSLAEFFSRYVTGALDLYLQAKRGVQSIAAYNPLAQLPMAATDALARMWMGSPFGAPYQQYPGYAAPPPPYPVAPPPMGVPPSAPPPDDGADDPPRKSEGRARTEPGDAARADGNRGDGGRADGNRGDGGRGDGGRGDGRGEAGRSDGRGEAGRSDEVAAMRRELEELKQALREGLAKPRKKRKP